MTSSDSSLELESIPSWENMFNGIKEIITKECGFTLTSISNISIDHDLRAIGLDSLNFTGCSEHIIKWLDTQCQIKISIDSQDWIELFDDEHLNLRIIIGFIYKIIFKKFAYNVFEDEKIAEDWLNTPKVVLGNKTPFELLETDQGIAEVKALLGRIEYGVYS